MPSIFSRCGHPVLPPSTIFLSSAKAELKTSRHKLIKTSIFLLYIYVRPIESFIRNHPSCPESTHSARSAPSDCAQGTCFKRRLYVAQRGRHRHLRRQSEKSQEQALFVFFR